MGVAPASCIRSQLNSQLSFSSKHRSKVNLQIWAFASGAGVRARHCVPYQQALRQEQPADAQHIRQALCLSNVPCIGMDPPNRHLPQGHQAPSKYQELNRGPIWSHLCLSPSFLGFIALRFTGNSLAA